MSEAEKQEGQKTVVAFITGLLIGGLLVWVFSSTPETEPTKVMESDSTTEMTTKSDDSKEAVVTTVKTAETTKVTPVAGNGSLTVLDQTAGDEVVLGATKYPDESGWIVVRDYANGVSGNVLGAARYNLNEGLLPVSVSLLRKAVSGSAYQVGFYADNGDKAFSLKEDALVTGGEATFKAK
jgi:hypothetical protein